MAKPRMTKATPPKKKAPPPTPPAYRQPNRPADYRNPPPETVSARNGSAEQHLLDGLI